MQFNSILEFRRKHHVKYLRRFLDILPSSVSSIESTRMTIAYFVVSGLDLLDSLDAISEEKRLSIINWIYSLQVVNYNDRVSGFQGSTTVNGLNKDDPNLNYKWGHLAATYCALCTLVILKDDLQKVNKKTIIEGVKALQLPNGCFTAAKEGTESDMRFLFCAASICYLLDDWSGLDVEAALNFIINCFSYDYGIGQEPELEAHGGSAYCAIATLILTKQLNKLPESHRVGITRWLLNRQVDGFHGRPNKPVDTCYSFWIGAALEMLGVYDLIDFEENRTFILSTQDNVVGGFSKWVHSNTDPLHTYLGLAGLSLMNSDGLNKIMPSLNISYEAHKHLKKIHEKWNNS